jgi:hypothetical protein
MVPARLAFWALGPIRRDGGGFRQGSWGLGVCWAQKTYAHVSSVEPSEPVDAPLVLFRSFDELTPNPLPSRALAVT